MKPSNVKKLKSRIKQLRNHAKKHRAILYLANEKADRLEKPLLLKETKEKFEGKYFQNIDERWEEYIYCEKITGYEKIIGGEISPTGIFIFINKSKMNKDEILISRRIMDYAGAYCKNEISAGMYATKINEILKHLKLHEY